MIKKSMIKNNIHKPVLLEEIRKFIPNEKRINAIDATFGGGGYSKLLLEEFNINKLIAIDRDPLSLIFAKDLIKKFTNFNIINGCFSEIDNLVSKENNNIETKFDVIIFDLGLSSNQLDNPDRGFSFMKNGPLDMDMGGAKLKASDIVNKFSEKKLVDIFFNLGDERFAKRIARNIVKFRKIKIIQNTYELVNLINNSIPKRNLYGSKINPATKTFQALRIYINDELNELKTALNKTIKLLSKNGKLIIVSFQSLEDRIVKDFFNHNSGKRWRSSRHYPELAEKGPITFKIITKKPIRPQEQEIKDNFRSRSAKLRIAEKLN
tara:strand:+ start:871 stop:1836 length:966 start_codon:yes stop_codon:yes gene_type:complete